MRIETTRTLFLALSFFAVAQAVTAWREPAPKILSSGTRVASVSDSPAAPLPLQQSDLLLLIFGLQQGARAAD